MGYLPIILFSLTLLFLITRPFTVLFHELGHAIPAIIITKQTVSIYIGSYGDAENSSHFKIGLLNVWFTRNPFTWTHGLCVPLEKRIPINKQIIYILTGPLTSLTIALVTCYFTFIYDLHGFFKIIFIAFFCSAIIDLSNLIPRKIPIKLYDGTLVYNDGYRLEQLFSYKLFSKDYEHALTLYNQKNFLEAAIAFNDILMSGLKDENIYRLAIDSYFQIGKYNEAKELFEKFSEQGKANSLDFSNAGFAYSQLNCHEEALYFYNKSLELDPKNKYSLYNKGFTFNLLNRYEEAIMLFDIVIDIENTFANSYSARGLAKIKMGNIKEGLDDINYSFTFDENNSYSRRNLGIYYLERGEYLMALDLFKKARETDPTTHMIDQLIETAKNHV